MLGKCFDNARRRIITRLMDNYHLRSITCGKNKGLEDAPSLKLFMHARDIGILNKQAITDRHRT
jgi:hypothetical protein